MRAPSCSWPRRASTTNQSVVAKDVIVVLDTSGSMEGEKIVQAKQAVSYVLQPPQHRGPLQHRRVQHRRPLLRRPVCNRQRRAGSRSSWVDDLVATGGTDINRRAARGHGDGRPRAPDLRHLPHRRPADRGRDRQSQSILNNVGTAAPDNVRLFAFGVGDDVDTFLLDTLVQEQHGVTQLCPARRADR